MNVVAHDRRRDHIVGALQDQRRYAESQQIVWRMRSKGAEVWYLAAKDEGHAFRKKANEDAYLETVAMFLNKLKAAR